MDELTLRTKINEFIVSMNEGFITAFREDRLGDDASDELQAWLALRAVLEDYKELHRRVRELEQKVEKLSKKKAEES